MKGLIVEVYRAARFGDCSLNGVTNRHDSFILTGEGVPEIFSANENRPELRYIKDVVMGAERHRAVPVDPETGRLLDNGMFGGNFVYDTDSRMPTKNPIKVHDRFE